MFSSSITSALYQHNQLRGAISDHMEILCHPLDLSVSLKLLSEINTIYLQERDQTVWRKVAEDLHLERNCQNTILRNKT